MKFLWFIFFDLGFLTLLRKTFPVFASCEHWDSFSCLQLHSLHSTHSILPGPQSFPKGAGQEQPGVPSPGAELSSPGVLCHLFRHQGWNWEQQEHVL